MIVLDTNVLSEAIRPRPEGSSKKGPSVWAFSIAMPGNRCPFASSICSRWCYADVGKFPLNHHIYQRNYEATKDAQFADRLRDEVVALAWRHSGRLRCRYSGSPDRRWPRCRPAL